MNEELLSLRDEMRESFAEMRREMRQGFEGLRGEVVELRQDVIALRVRIDALEQRVGGLEQRVGGLDQRVGGLDQRVGGLDQRLEVLEQRVTANGVLLEALRDEVHQLAEAHTLLAAQVERQNRRQDVTNEQLALLRAFYRDLDRRVTRLETQAGHGEPGV
jgi:chromosome segregation ATPase